MDMLVVSGFLGSGKTTMILATIGRYIEATGKRVVIIVNDFGKIGIDGTLMKKYGLNVRDMPSGCICCSLGDSFLETVSTVASEFSPDLILVEPTGIADPTNIVEIMSMYQGPAIGSIRVFVVVDAVRFDMVFKALSAPMRKQINVADLIIINKIDEADPAILESLRGTLASVNSGKKVVEISAATGKNLDLVLREMMAR